MFGWGRSAAITKRANQLRLLVALIASNLHTKSYEEFATFYQQFGAGVELRPPANREFNFGFKFGQDCWYDAHAEFHEPRSLSMMGGGNDYGVFITIKPEGEGAWVDLEVPHGQRPGRDAKAMVKALLDRPGFSSLNALTAQFSR